MRVVKLMIMMIFIFFISQTKLIESVIVPFRLGGSWNDEKSLTEFCVESLKGGEQIGNLGMGRSTIPKLNLKMV
jgi:hypothetical protein